MIVVIVGFSGCGTSTNKIPLNYSSNYSNESSPQVTGPTIRLSSDEINFFETFARIVAFNSCEEFDRAPKAPVPPSSITRMDKEVFIREGIRIILRILRNEDNFPNTPKCKYAYRQIMRESSSEIALAIEPILASFYDNLRSLQHVRQM